MQTLKPYAHAAQKTKKRFKICLRIQFCIHIPVRTQSRYTHAVQCAYLHKKFTIFTWKVFISVMLITISYYILHLSSVYKVHSVYVYSLHSYRVSLLDTYLYQYPPLFVSVCYISIFNPGVTSRGSRPHLSPHSFISDTTHMQYTVCTSI